MNWNEEKFRGSLNDLPADRDTIRAAGEAFGRGIAQKARQQNVPPEEIVNAVRTGLEYHQSASTSSR